MSEILFLIVNLFKAVLQVAFGLFDQTHYHVAAVKTHCNIAVQIVVNYFCCIPKHFLAHVWHGEYLRSLGLEQASSLRDTGSLVWRSFRSEGNVVGSKPVESVTGIVNNVSENPAHISLAATALAKSWFALESVPLFAYEDAVYVDFGCGTGFALLAAMTKPFPKIIGVELHEKSANLARQNIQTFQSVEHRRVDIKCQKVTVETMNMCDFTFDRVYTEQCREAHCAAKHAVTVVLHVDEPLWNVPKADAHVIYKQVFSAAQKSGFPVLVAYFYCGRFNGDALPALQELGAELLYQCDCDSLNFSSDDRFYLYKLC